MPRGCSQPWASPMRPTAGEQQFTNTELPFQQLNAARCREHQQQAEMLDEEQKSMKAMNEQNNIKN